MSDVRAASAIGLEGDEEAFFDWLLAANVISSLPFPLTPFGRRTHAKSVSLRFWLGTPRKQYVTTWI